MRISFPYSEKEIGGVEIEDGLVAGVYEPKAGPAPDETLVEMVRDAIERPIGSPALGERARGAKRVTIVADDISRTTPVREMLPVILETLNAAGVKDSQMTGLVALGTHRDMTPAEMDARYGRRHTSRIRFVNHAWRDGKALVDLGRTTVGIPVRVNRLVAEADLVVGIGHIVPHGTAGFSGGAKIIMPGASGAETVGATHWKSLDYPPHETFGCRNNPIREAMDEIVRKLGNVFIVNAVPRPDGRPQAVFAGDPVLAHADGCAATVAIYGARVRERTNIVLTDAYPTDIDLRQAIKAVYAASLVVRDGGTIVLVSPCPEGVAPQFPEFVAVGFRRAAEIRKLVDEKRLDPTAGYTLGCIGEILARPVRVIAATPGVTADEMRRLFFVPAGSAQEGLDLAVRMTREPRVTVLRHGGEILPIVAG
ncbi:MAG: nickel-dependent lactate racemase [Planctomycetota bacterium]